MGDSITVTTKVCSRCRQEKASHLFPRDRKSATGLYCKCKECVSEIGKHRYTDPVVRLKVLSSQQKYRSENIELRRDTVRKSQKKHAKAKAEYNKAYYQRPERKAHVRELYRTYRKCPQRRAAINARYRIHASIRRAGGTTYIQCLGTTAEGLLKHIESQFKTGMSWDTYGRDGWHIDHITPLSLFNLLDPEQCKVAFHYTNLQPLWWYENLSKGNRLYS